MSLFLRTVQDFDFLKLDNVMYTNKHFYVEQFRLKTGHLRCVKFFGTLFRNVPQKLTPRNICCVCSKSFQQCKSITWIMAFSIWELTIDILVIKLNISYYSDNSFREYGQNDSLSFLTSLLNNITAEIEHKRKQCKMLIFNVMLSFRN